MATMRLYRTYLALVAVALLVGVVVGLWTWVVSAPIEGIGTYYLLTWGSGEPVKWIAGDGETVWDVLRTHSGNEPDHWAGPFTQPIELWRSSTPHSDSIRNGLIAALVAYLVLLLTIIPARALRQPKD